MPWTYLHSLGSYRESTVTLRDHQQHATTHSANGAMHIVMMPRWQRHISRPSHGYTGHRRTEVILLVTFSASQLSHLPQTATDTRVRKAHAASAQHRHAVNRGGVVDAGRTRQPRTSRSETMLAHVAACHGQTHHSRLGGGGDALLERRWCAAASIKSRSRRPMRGRQCAGDVAGGAQSAALVATIAWWSCRAAGETSIAGRQSVQIAHWEMPPFLSLHPGHL